MCLVSCCSVSHLYAAGHIQHLPTSADPITDTITDPITDTIADAIADTIADAIADAIADTITNTVAHDAGLWFYRPSALLASWALWA